MFNIQIKKTVFFLFNIFFSMVLLSDASYASETFFSIQTGTYSHTALSFAEKQFDLLAEKLGDDEKQELRIEKGSKYYIVRLGLFNNTVQAEKALKNVKMIASDAFILQMKDLEGVEVIKSYAGKQIKSDPDEKLANGSDELTGKMNDQESESNISESADDDIVSGPGSSPEDLPVDGNTESPINKLIEDVAVQYNNKDYEKASELLKKGLRKWPNDPDLHAWYGATLLDSGSPEKAYKEYRKAAELMPDVPDFHAGMGHSLLDSYIDRAKNSVTTFKKALEIDPDNVSALEGLGIVYVSMGKKILAAEIYEHLKEVDTEAAERLNEFIIWGLDWGELK